MEEKKEKTSSEAKKKAKSSGKKERKKEGEKYEEMKKEEEKKEEIKVQEEPREAVQQEFSQQESEYGKNLLSSIIQKTKDRINSQIQIAKNMYSLFQGMKQAYGGDTKKVLQVAFGFAKEEIKRRAKEKANEIKEKANEIREKAKKIVKI
jgi:hypothetical protein